MNGTKRGAEPHILLVDEDQARSRTVTYALGCAGITAEAVASTTEAEGAVAAGHVSVLVIDVDFPDGTGLRFFRDVVSPAGIPAILLGSRDDEAIVVYALDLGADDYLSRPVRVSELAARIRAVLRRHAASTGVARGPGVSGDGAAADILQSGELRIDRQERMAYSSGQRVPLTDTEFRLLEILVACRGAVVPRHRLIARIWDRHERYVDENTLSVHIRRLREKLETESGARSPIVTVRGVGYRWAAPEPARVAVTS